jgi:hypothetical protein
MNHVCIYMYPDTLESFVSSIFLVASIANVEFGIVNTPSVRYPSLLFLEPIVVPRVIDLLKTSVNQIVTCILINQLVI